MVNILDRRDLMAAVGAVGIAANVRASQVEDDAPPAPNAPASPVRFTHNVASGDPTQSAVVIWTRAEPAAPGVISVAWEVSTTEDFAEVLKSGTAATQPERDFIVKVDVTGLAPGGTYYYRFKAGDAVSPVGRTRTFAAPNTPEAQRKLTVAVFCCANVGNGFFNVYRHAAERDDIDVCLHIGDYIYEYGPWIAPEEESAKGNRIAEPRKKLVTLADYRLRYGSYRLDPDLQEVHRRHPFIVAWDDHEICNNAYKAGSENHWGGDEGTWEQRKARAIQAYFEWMPIRPPRGSLYEPERTPDMRPQIFRKFDVGDLATIIMLDTRIHGRDPAPGGGQMVYLMQPRPNATPGLDGAAKQVEQWAMPYDTSVYPPKPRPDLFEQVGGDAKKLPPGMIFMPNYAKYISDVLNAERTILGDEQETWLTETLRTSKAEGKPWQILGNQTIAATFVPVNPEKHRNPDRDAGFAPDYIMRMKLQEEHGVPFASDTWGGGYPRSRDRLIETLREHANNTVIFSGDIHNAWSFKHTDSKGDMRAFEVTTASVTSPGMESFMGVGPSYVGAMMKKNPQMLYGEVRRRGYATVTFTPEAATAEWVFVNTIRSKEFTAEVDKSITVAARSEGSGMRVLG
jgi:alkaline phosphatase D